MRIVRAVLTVAAFGLVTSAAALADDFPSKEVKIIVNYGAGGAVDRTARSMQRFLPEALGQSVVVENVRGAGGKIGITKFMKAKRDGYTILTSFAPSTTYVATTAPDIYKFDDLAVINLQWVDPAVLLVHQKTGWKTLDDVIAAIRANPGKYTFASSGNTSVGHVLAMDLFKKLKLDVKIVPYKGGGKTRAAFIGGETDMTAAGIQGALKTKAVAIPVALFADSASDVWPEAPPVNSLLAKEGITAEIGGAYRFHAVHADVKRNHPERFKKLVDAFKTTTAENPDFLAFAKNTATGKAWLGPDASTDALRTVETRFSKLFK
ncbi:MAG: tripartite tricarboxylate transporter substrate binding protein [Pseudomonadota bacterium]